MEDVDVFVFDEYLSGVNQDWAIKIHKNIIQILKENNKIGIFITHNKEEAKICNRIIYIKNNLFLNEI